MKRLSDKELAVITQAASYLTEVPNGNPEVVDLAFRLWTIYDRHMTEDRRNEVYKIRKNLFNL